MKSEFELSGIKETFKNKKKNSDQIWYIPIDFFVTREEQKIREFEICLLQETFEKLKEIY